METGENEPDEPNQSAETRDQNLVYAFGGTPDIRLSRTALGETDEPHQASNRRERPSGRETYEESPDSSPAGIGKFRPLGPSLSFSSHSGLSPQPSATAATFGAPERSISDEAMSGGGTTHGHESLLDVASPRIEETSAQSHSSARPSPPRRPLPRAPSGLSSRRGSIVLSQESHSQHSSQGLHLQGVSPPPAVRSPRHSPSSASEVPLMIASHLLSTHASELARFSITMREASESMDRMAKESSEWGRILVEMVNGRGSSSLSQPPGYDLLLGSKADLEAARHTPVTRDPLLASDPVQQAYNSLNRQTRPRSNRDGRLSPRAEGMNNLSSTSLRRSPSRRSASRPLSPRHSPSRPLSPRQSLSRQSATRQTPSRPLSPRQSLSRPSPTPTRATAPRPLSPRTSPVRPSPASTNRKRQTEPFPSQRSLEATRSERGAWASLRRAEEALSTAMESVREVMQSGIVPPSEDDLLMPWRKVERDERGLAEVRIGSTFGYSNEDLGLEPLIRRPLELPLTRVSTISRAGSTRRKLSKPRPVSTPYVKTRYPDRGVVAVPVEKKRWWARKRVSRA